MVIQQARFSFQRGAELAQKLIQASQQEECGYWQIQFDCLAGREQPFNLYIAVANGRLFYSGSDLWTVETLLQSLRRFVPQSHSDEAKAYFEWLTKSPQRMASSPVVVVQEMIGRQLFESSQVMAGLRLKLLTDFDTYLMLGAGKAEFIPDNELVPLAPLGGFTTSEIFQTALERQMRWQTIRVHIPALNLVPVLNQEAFAKANLTDSQRQWIQKQVQRKKNLMRIAAALVQDPLDIANAFSKLVQSGLIRLLSPDQMNTSTILVIDDSPLVLRQFQEWVSVWGYSIVVCQHADKALEMLTKIKPGVAFIDINMPNISGFELVKQIRQTSQIAKTPLVILTAEQKLSNKWRAQWSGCEFLSKPLSLSEVGDFQQRLQQLIRELVDGISVPLDVQAS
jgi:CheY-like chemotaxis protein